MHDDATLFALFKYALRGELPDDYALLDRVATAIDRIDTDRRKRDEARQRRAQRALEAKAARLEAQIKAQLNTHQESIQAPTNPDTTRFDAENKVEFNPQQAFVQADTPPGAARLETEINAEPHTQQKSIQAHTAPGIVRLEAEINAQPTTQQASVQADTTPEAVKEESEINTASKASFTEADAEPRAIVEPQFDPNSLADCAQLFATFAPKVRAALAISETVKIEAEQYPTFKKFIKTFSPNSNYNPEANWTRFRHSFPTTWPDLCPQLSHHLANSTINRRTATPAEFLTHLKQTLAPHTQITHTPITHKLHIPTPHATI